MALKDVVNVFQRNGYFRSGVVFRQYLAPRPGVFMEFPESCSTQLVESLNKRGISRLYSHQHAAYTAAMGGQNLVVVTPTASGKTLCYNLPILDTMLKQPGSRALYMFPTKALAQDQLAELRETTGGLQRGIKVFTYDGDTPVDARRSIRQAAEIVITNPDMLHTGILPHHTKWISLFENLKFVVVDEMHSYRGVFGSHMAHVIRRLKRVCRHYGADPVFIMCSATIANPGELAEKLGGEPFRAVTENGAPGGGKYFIFYNPPVVNEELGIRRSSLNEAQRIAGLFMDQGYKTIAFARSRLKVELLGKYLRERETKKVRARVVRTYRGGYLPRERREIEEGLREGRVDGVVSTNAMELGVDIGELDVCVMSGYPGSIASTWQQAGRAGRRNKESAAVLVASSAPVDQYLVRNPRYFLEQSPEMGLINPDNIIIKAEHLKCACYELPVAMREMADNPETVEILDFLEENRFLHRVEGRYYWVAESFPANEVSLRSVASENVLIIDTTGSRTRIIGEMARSSALTMLYEGAIYLHQNVQYQVHKFDFAGCRAYVRQVKVDYYTDADLAVDFKVLTVFGEDKTPALGKKWGELMVTRMPTIFKKIKYRTHENVGSGPINLPEEEMHTSGFWLSLAPPVVRDMSNQEKEYALMGLANLYQNLAPIFLMCDSNDIGVVPQTKAADTGLPTVFVYDRYPGGTGLSEGLFKVNAQVMQAALELVSQCECRGGCPSCIGPPQLVGEATREKVVNILRQCLRRG